MVDYIKDFELRRDWNEDLEIVWKMLKCLMGQNFHFKKTIVIEGLV